MQSPNKPPDEQGRLAALQALRILDTAPEERFNRKTRIAAYIADAPIALVSLVDADRQWFKSRVGLDATETPRDISFCGHAILRNEIFIVPDTLLDDRFADNPLVTGGPKIRFYAGIPLQLPNGFRVGTLCVIGPEPKVLTQTQIDRLQDLAEGVVAELQQRDIAENALAVHSQSERLRTILETVVDGIITIDDKGIVQSVNRATETMFGYTTDEIVGQNIKMLMPEPYHSAHDGYLDNYRTSRTARIIGIGREVVARRKDGSTFPMYLAVAEMKVGKQVLFTGIVRDISAAKALERSMQEALGFQKAILDSADAAIISTDEAGTILSFNRAAESMLGYSEEEVVGKTSPGLFHVVSEVVARAEKLSVELGVPVEPGFDVFVAKAKLGMADKNEWTHVRKDGSQFPAELSVTSLRHADGSLKGFMGIAADITERKKMERVKSEFISTVSHELRTPLTSIRGALGLVLSKFNEGMSEKARKLLDTANRNSERLTLLINDILDLEKLEAGRMDFSFSANDLVTVTRQAINANSGYADQHNVRLVLKSCPPAAPAYIDDHRLQQVFSNLISNAVKYSPANGEVEIGISDDGDAWRISVRDYGRGISEEFRARIFQRFAQADSSDAREKGGTGLGLSITRAIVERHNGRLDFISEAGTGTEFFVHLPKWQETRQLAAHDGRPRVLLCEDNRDVALVLSEMLSQHGLATDHVTTGAAARQLLVEGKYRALLLDLGLPDIDGIALIRQLRNYERTRALPIIVVSGRPRDNSASLDIEGLNIFQWLQKPVDRQLLTNAIENARGPGRRPRVLHVEDDLDVVQVVQDIIDSLVDYEYATTTAEARVKLMANKYDLLLLDLSLPDGDGRALLDALDAGTRVIIFSGEKPPALQANVAAMLVKSQASNDKLLSTIKRTLGLS